MENSASITINSEEVENHFLNLLNEERSKKGLSKLSTNETIQNLAYEHSLNMANHGYVGHRVPPDNKNISTRYRQAGLVPQCNINVSGTDKHYIGAEAVYMVYVSKPMKHHYSNESIIVDSNKDLAKAFFDGWINSDTYKEIMLLEDTDQIGLGIANNGTKFYGTLNLC